MVRTDGQNNVRDSGHHASLESGRRAPREFVERHLEAEPDRRSRRLQSESDVHGVTGVDARSQLAYGKRKSRRHADGRRQLGGAPHDLLGTDRRRRQRIAAEQRRHRDERGGAGASVHDATAVCCHGRHPVRLSVSETALKSVKSDDFVGHKKSGPLVGDHLSRKRRIF